MTKLISMSAVPGLLLLGLEHEVHLARVGALLLGHRVQDGGAASAVADQVEAQVAGDAVQPGLHLEALVELEQLDAAELAEQRYQKYRRMGVFLEG